MCCEIVTDLKYLPISGETGGQFWSQNIFFKCKIVVNIIFLTFKTSDNITPFVVIWLGAFCGNCLELDNFILAVQVDQDVICKFMCIILSIV